MLQAEEAPALAPAALAASSLTHPYLSFRRPAARPGKSGNMGLTMSKVFSRLFGKKEMRILMVRGAACLASARGCGQRS